MVKYPEIKVKLAGEDGNAFVIISRVTSSLRKAKVPKDEIDKFQEEAMSGDYNHLLQTCCKWVSVK